MTATQKFFKSFAYAFNGIKYFFLHERNGRVQLFIAAAVVAAAVGLKLAAIEWIAVLLCIAMVMGLEMLNSALEKLCDEVHEEYHPKIKIIKDVAAGAVLWVSIVSAVIGCIIFIPKIIALL